MLFKTSPLMIFLLLGLLLLNSCNEDEPTQPVVYPKGPEAKFVLGGLITEKYPGPTVKDSIIYCPRFIGGSQFHIGDTLAVSVSQEFGAQIFGSDPVYATVTSKFGDSETYWLRSGFWPCETRVSDIDIYHAVIFYNSKPLGLPLYPFPNNGQLEIRTTGDTLEAFYVSYSTLDTLRNTVALIPR